MQNSDSSQFQLGAWTPALAYVVGLLATDGNLSKDRRHITFRSSDIEQINNFKKCLMITNKIGVPTSASPFSQRPCYRIQFGNVKFYRWLTNIGLTPLKTHTIGKLSIPHKYFRDFLRGHLDGDGSITTYRDSYHIKKHPNYIYRRLAVRFISVSYEHLKWIHEVINEILDTAGHLNLIKSKKSGRHDMWQLKYMKKDSVRLLNWLYYDENIPCLSRKRKKAKSALREIEMIKRKPYERRSA